MEDQMKVFFKRIDSIIEKTLRIFNCILAAGLVIVIFLETFSRYFFLKSHGWTNEFLRYSLVWMTFLSMMNIAREDKHLRMEMLFKKFPPKLQIVMNIIGLVLSIAMSVVFFVIGVRYCIQFGASKAPLMGISMGIVYACLPAGFFFLLYQQLIDLIRYIIHIVKGGS